jgi:hypothetical protein
MEVLELSEALLDEDMDDEESVSELPPLIDHDDCHDECQDDFEPENEPFS